MNSEKILKLLKSGIWEDALIAFNFMKDWTIEDAKREFGNERVGAHGFAIDLGRSTHILTVKINNNLYAGSGGIYSLWFTDSLNSECIEI